MSQPRQELPQQIPVVVLAGFLGSGKTTLLNHLLHHGGGTRIGAIVNDFGSIEIDAMAVAGQLGDSTVSLGNGCLCCAVDASELDEYLDRLTRPSARNGIDGTNGIDVIVIEASGLAEPQELVRMVLASENPRIVYGGLVEVVDAVEFDATRERHPELDRHLAIADLVVVNKADRIPETEHRRVLESVRGLAGGAAVVPATYARVDPEFLFDCRPTGSGSDSCRSTTCTDITKTVPAATATATAQAETETGTASTTCTTDISTPPTTASPSSPKCRSIHAG